MVVDADNDKTSPVMSRAYFLRGRSSQSPIPKFFPDFA